jgi:hypothetical protein
MVDGGWAEMLREARNRTANTSRARIGLALKCFIWIYQYLWLAMIRYGFCSEYIGDIPAEVVTSPAYLCGVNTGCWQVVYTVPYDASIEGF